MEHMGMDLKRCFKILEIKETDSLDEIKQAYRDLISIWHPDRYAQRPRLQEKATEKVKELNSAYNYLISHTTQIRMTRGAEKKAEKDPSGVIVVICPKCQAMNRFQADRWVRQRRCIYCNASLLNEHTAFRHTQAPSEKMARYDGTARKKKRGGFRWILLLTAGCVGLFFLAVPHIRIPFVTHTEDRPEEKEAVDPFDVSLGKKRIVEIQRFLGLLSYDPGPMDGMLGNKTRRAIEQFKADFSIQPAGTAQPVWMHALERHAGIAKLHPEWPAVYKSKDFADWIETQRITSSEACRRVITNGSVLQVASLLDFYKFDRIGPDPVKLPPSGVMHKRYVKGLAPLTIETSNDGRHYYVKLIRERDRSEVFSAFLRSGFTLTEHVPVGTYRLKYAVGKTWYGFKWFFGSDTVFNSVDQVFDFRFEENEIKGYRLSLYLVPLRPYQGRRSYAFDF